MNACKIGYYSGKGV